MREGDRVGTVRRGDVAFTHGFVELVGPPAECETLWVYLEGVGVSQVTPRM